MIFPVGSIPYLRDLSRRKLKAGLGRLEEMQQLAAQNFTDWPTMTDVEKDQANRQLQRGFAELCSLNRRAIRFLLDDLKPEE